MKEFIKILMVCCVLLTAFNSESFVAAYCPSPEEYTQAARNFADKAKHLTLNGGSVAEAEALLFNYNKYKKDTFYNCINYYQSTTKSDCDRLKVLYSSYLEIGQDKQAAEKTRLNAILNSLSKTCSVDVSIIRTMMR